MKSRFLTLLCLPLLLFTQLGCLWDRDTIASEMKGREDVVKILVGWFDRNPPEYYQMRLERVTAELAENPEQLDLYDDAAVACDRLGKPNEAIAWMEKKKQYLYLEPQDAPQPNHHYRTLANLGTFYAHRWIQDQKAGTKDETSNSEDTSAENGAINFADLEQAEKLIAQAIKENPDAHFGREKYQLLVIELLQSGIDSEGYEENPLDKLIASEFPYTSDQGYLNELGIPDAVDGLAGMIELGAGWNSFDLYALVGRTLQAEGRSNPAFIADARAKELLELGQKSLIPTVNEQNVSKISSLEKSVEHTFVEQPKRIKNYYEEIKTLAQTRHQNRLDYMKSRFEAGEHPDTHPDFWNQWVELDFLKPPLSAESVESIFSSLVSTVLLCALVIFCLIALLVILKKIRPV